MVDTIDPAAQSDDVKYWLEQIEGAQRWRQDWYERGQKVVDRYLDKRDVVNSTASHKMNTLWSNVQTTMPALYAKTPNPKVTRRFRDKDAIGRWAAIVLERCLVTTFDQYDVDHHIRNAISDYLLPGMGQIWESYEADIGKDQTGKEVLNREVARCRYRHWKDFLTNPARTFDEVWWMAGRAYMSREEVEKRFGKPVAEKLTFSEQEDDKQPGDTGKRIKKAAVWEIWSKPHKKVFFVSKLCPDLLQAPSDPFVNFDGFFPCPRPLTTTTVTDSMLPVPDFCQYQNQADEIDRLSQRINLLTKALRVAGVYDASQEALGRLLDDSDNNVMIPAENWAVLAAQNGLDGSISFFPIGEIIQALKQCYESREAAKATMYEITGISDIVRGASDPNETATAQQIKSQWGGLRIRDRQKEVQRFVRDVIRLKAEVIAEHFQQDTLKAMSNAPLFTQAEKQQVTAQLQMAQQQAQMGAQQAAMTGQPPPPPPAPPPEILQKLREPTWEEVVALLKDEKLRGFRIDIETDSTIQADEMEEKQSRVEFMTALTTFAQAWGPMIATAPQFAGLAGEALLFTARAFKGADALETAIEEAVDGLNQQAKAGPPQPAGPPPDPKMELENKRHEFEKQKYQDERADARADKEREFANQDRAHAASQQQFEQTLNAKSEGERAKAEAMGKPTTQVQIGGAEIATVMQDMFKAMADANAQGQQAILAAVETLAKAATAPKNIAVQRDAQGRIVGGIAAPVSIN